MSHFEISKLCKQYGENVIVDHLDLSIKEGEFISLLGPSGCGKTTTLRMIAGLLKPTSGSIKLGEKELSSIPTHKRNIGLVFQNYSLFPHLTVFNNIAFGLKRRKVPVSEIKQRVTDVLESVQLSGMEERFPTQLSGGQQQRVALARALVLRPPMVLFDEPLSNLDAKLRQFLRVEIRQLQQKHGFTAIFVTHDQEEAMVLSDRIAVMNKGKIAQLGTPTEIYSNPADSFVADFVGETNMMKINDVKNNADIVSGVLADGTKISIKNRGQEIKDSIVMVRPQDVVLSKTSEALDKKNSIKGKVEFIHFIGDKYLFGIKTAVQDKIFMCSLSPEEFIRLQITEGNEVYATWEIDSTFIF